jgi:hypothetical protein
VPNNGGKKMKKIIILLGFALMAIGVFAQNTPSVTASMPANGNYIQYYKATDVDSAYSTTAKNWDFFIGKNFIYAYNVVIDADTGRDVSNRAFTVQLYGSDDDVNYYTVGSAVTWNVTVDTVIQISDISTTAKNVIWIQEISTNNDTLQYPAVTRCAWRYLRVKLTGANTTAKCYMHKITISVFKREEDVRII